ncbi:class B sortase [Paludicola sp. MB14-C6]|uniref:class B sortase n=1 Tax=Paludihabitans sp. MB14-C6 TaxID=3070656 RepID=UPI0027DC706C|nr:class B sortase [Paludicola sp. MB14-C6]WMJ22125.1 class B sortase [Paludicola sp. MB14-C6]
MKMTTGKTKGKKSVARIILLVAICVVLIFAVVIGALLVRKYAAGKQFQKEAQEFYNPVSSIENKDGTPSKSGNTIDKKTGVVKDFNKLYEINKDTIGWLSIPETRLDLPVAKASDNTYYLNHTITKKSYSLGIPFADSKATFTKDKQSNNITIYSHAAKDGSYFAVLKNYKDVAFYKSHPNITFNTIYGTGNYKIIGLFMEDVSDNNKAMFNYHDYTDMNEAQFNDYVANVMKRNYFKTSVDTKFGDQLITLSTCDYEVNNTDFRIALVARKVRAGESAKVDTGSAVKNANQMMPARWYEKKDIKNPFAK